MLFRTFSCQKTKNSVRLAVELPVEPCRSSAFHLVARMPSAGITLTYNLWSFGRIERPARNQAYCGRGSRSQPQEGNMRVAGAISRLPKWIAVLGILTA